MTHEEANIELFKNEARKVFVMNAPWLPAGVPIGVDPDKYTEFKNSLGDKIMGINAPDIDDKTKWDIIAALEDDLDSLIRNNGKKAD